MKLKLTITLLLLQSLLFCQERQTNQDDKKYSYEVDIGLGTYYQFTTFGFSPLNSIKIPEQLPRRINEPDVRDTWNLNSNQVTDNPFFHGSYFFKLGARFQFGKILKVTGAINAEQRGFSDGVFSKRTRNFYPYLNAVLSDTLGKFQYLFQMGDFRNFKLYEGLTFYNLETQSWIFKLKFGDFYFKHAGIADLLIGIGLGIDDVYDYSFGIEDFAINKDSSFVINLKSGYSNNRGFTSRGFWNFSTSLKYKDQFSFYAQVSTIDDNSNAFLVGFKTKNTFANKINLKSSIEYRGYDSNFNLLFSNVVYYRDPNLGPSFTNSRNNVFIPLDYYERNFSQWALFTEYQNVDINGLNIRTEVDYNFFKNLYFRFGLDLNWLISNDETFLYPFYLTSIGIKPHEEIEISLQLTNKVMNFDKNFPTFYASIRPYFIIRLYKPLRFIQENDSNHLSNFYSF